MTDQGFTIAPVDRNRIGAVAAKHGLKAIKLGMRLNTAYTPKNCRAMAERLTGRKFKARDYDGMIAALDEYLNPGLPTVAVWHEPSRSFVQHIPCEGERRVRLDVHDSLDNYSVYEATIEHKDGFMLVTPVSTTPLADWRIDLS